MWLSLATIQCQKPATGVRKPPLRYIEHLMVTAPGSEHYDCGWWRHIVWRIAATGYTGAACQCTINMKKCVKWMWSIACLRRALVYKSVSICYKRGMTLVPFLLFY
jgi:hypothetical protein